MFRQMGDLILPSERKECKAKTKRYMLCRNQDTVRWTHYDLLFLWIDNCMFPKRWCALFEWNVYWCPCSSSISDVCMRIGLGWIIVWTCDWERRNVDCNCDRGSKCVLRKCALHISCIFQNGYFVNCTKTTVFFEHVRHIKINSNVWQLLNTIIHKDKWKNHLHLITVFRVRTLPYTKD